LGSEAESAVLANQDLLAFWTMHGGIGLVKGKMRSGLPRPKRPLAIFADEA
jgi:hypothetical protein